MTSRPVPVARVQRLQDIHSRASRLASAAGARNGALLAAAPAAEDGTTSAELWLYGVVGGYWWGFNDKTVADQLRGLNVDHITVRLNSPGGDAIQGVAIGNLLRNHKATVTVVIDGLAASAASIIAIAGDEVVMSPGSQFMVHDPWFYTVGNAKDLRQDADFLDKQGANMAAVYALEAGGTAEQWRERMTADPDGTWYSADEAVAANLADRVGTVVAVSAAPEPPTVDLDDEDDDMAARAAWDLEVLIPPTARSAWSYSPPAASAEGITHTDEGDPAMAFTPEQVTNMRQELGLPETADEATIVAALAEALAERATDTPPAASIPEGHVVIPAAKLADLEAGAKQALETAASLRAKERDAFLDSVRDKFLPSSRAGWEAEYDRDEAGVRAHFAAAPVLIPTTELGKTGETEAGLTPYDELYGNQQKGA